MTEEEMVEQIDIQQLCGFAQLFTGKDARVCVELISPVCPFVLIKVRITPNILGVASVEFYGMNAFGYTR